MAARKKLNVKEYIEKYNSAFMRFGEAFVRQITDKELIAALAQKDLEKLTKVWKLVFEMIAENSDNGSQDKLIELIGEYSELDKEEDGE